VWQDLYPSRMLAVHSDEDYPMDWLDILGKENQSCPIDLYTFRLGLGHLKCVVGEYSRLKS